MDWLNSYGVVDFGYTEDPVPTTLEYYNQWVAANLHAPLHYLEGERQEKRQDLKNHWQDFQSAVVFLFSYHPTHSELQNLYQKNPNWNGLKLASYTLGFEGWDYHNLLREKLESIGECLKKDHGVEFRLTLDTHPVLERDLAKRAGLGWFGKNSMLINRHQGSFFIIGSLLLDKKLDLKTKAYETDHCGQCTRCIDACPTEAIDPVSRTIIAKDCISTFTIEQFKLDTIPSEKMTLKEGTLFGCDICQDVCPWNKRVDRQNSVSLSGWSDQQKKILDFFLLRPVEKVHQNLEEMSGKEFERVMEKTSFARSGRRGLLKNIRFYLKKD
ncbi:epoxyqueuosine reductase [Bacteriovorax stolpii]|nr:tRNA epoxyqueuosine(34) reductase QueG [Bacteriovorax stolpii]TDP51710.1 epoxyqueuosine reductase [Bacteriovorax stolpii]